MFKWIAIAGGLAFFAAVGAIHGVTATAAGSMPALVALWLFAAAPLAFVWLIATKPGGRARVVSLGYLTLSAVLAVTVLGGVGWIGSERAIHPSPCNNEPQLADYPALQPQIEPVKFASRDGTSLAGWFVEGTSPATVVLVHGYGCERHDMLPQASFLHAAGYSVLLFDLRNCGESGGDAVTLGYREQQDVLGAIDYLKTRPDVDGSRIGALGVSMGGSTVIMAAAQTPDIKAVVSESGFKSANSSIEQAFTHFIHLPAFPYAPITTQIIEWRLGLQTSQVVPEAVVGQIVPRPVLIIHGLQDKTISPDDAHALYAAAGQPKELWLIPTSGHANGAEKDASDYAQRVTKFFDRNL